MTVSMARVVFVIVSGLGILAWFIAALKNKSALMALLAVGALVATAMAQQEAPGSAAQMLVWFSASTSLAPISSVLLQVVRQFEPNLEDKTAMGLSAVASFLVVWFTRLLLPYAGDVALIVDNQSFLALTWIMQQLWYFWGSEKAMPRLYA